MSGGSSNTDPQELPVDEAELLRVCRIGRAQGLKGEVSVRLFTDEPEERFEPGAVLFSRDGSTEYVVQRARAFKDRWYLKLEGVDDRTAAEALNGTELYGEAWELDDDEFYPKDIVGLEARLRTADGPVIGTVVDMTDNAQWLLKIRLAHPVGDERTALVPFVEALVPQVDLDGGVLVIDPPGGLIPGVDRTL
ncbi:ribosome maturation factor RimM [Bifidobacterium cuniculi]|uniref:Ribosome maturation factor RimM n=1 Tax=Bifidobacterium cuniculi TaxID=1688 RepID=A0A087AJK9_9BIFI|nr:ribosome maturation factor RimM [Bifidobacterium cuniculi]KFI58959.1 16S rRNA-processing protein rimM [Bifidobacterium cuniculi]